MKKKILTILLAIALMGNMLAADTVVYAAGENTSEDYLEKENDVLEIMDDQVSEEKIVEDQVNPESIQEVSENTLAEIATESGEEDNSGEKIEAYKNIETMVKTSVSDAENANDRDLDVEGTDDFEKAAKIDMGNMINDSITETVSARVYQFSLASAGRLSIEMTSYMQYYTIQIFDATGAEVWRTTENEWNGNLKYRQDTYNIDLIAGSYYIKVTANFNFSWTSNATGNYSFKTGFQSANETFAEPNNDFVTAGSIYLGQIVNGQIAVNDSKDLYKFQLASAGRLQIDMTSYMQYYTIQIFDATGAEVWRTTENEWNGNLKYRQDTYNIDLIAGSYYIKVTANFNFSWTSNATGNYSFKTGFQSANETFAEPNNDFVTAVSIYMEQMVNGQIAVNDSKDIYVFNLLGDTGVALKMDAYLAYYTLEIYDINGKLVWYTDDNYWNEKVKYRKDVYDTELSAGQYYMCVTGCRFKGNGNVATGNYMLSLNAQIPLSGATVSKIADKTYTGDYINPQVKVTYQGKVLQQDTDYEVEYTNNLYIGTATVIITGKGAYYGTKEIYFKIKPVKPKKVSAKNAGKKRVMIKWQSTSQNVYYVVYRSTKKNSGYKKIAAVKNRYTTYYCDKKVRRKKIYYYKVRAYATVNGKKQYSSYSSAKKLKTK